MVHVIDIAFQLNDFVIINEFDKTNSAGVLCQSLDILSLEMLPLEDPFVGLCNFTSFFDDQFSLFEKNSSQTTNYEQGNIEINTIIDLHMFYLSNHVFSVLTVNMELLHFFLPSWFQSIEFLH